MRRGSSRRPTSAGRPRSRYARVATIASRPIGTRRSLLPLPRARRTPASRSTSPTSSAIASDPRSPHAYMSSSSARSRRAAGSVPRGAASSFATSPRLRTCGRRWLLGGGRGWAGGGGGGGCWGGGGRVVVDRVLAAQVAVERPQARGLALQRRGRDRRALLAARRELRQERREVGVLGGHDIRAAPAQERAELQQVRPVGLERVARQPALELEV